MKVALVTDFYYPWIGGPAGLLRNLGHGLHARGHSVYLAAPSPTGPAYREEDGPIEVTRFRAVKVPFGYNLRGSVVPAREMTSWLSRVKPDVVHIHHPFPISATAVWATRRRGIPCAATNHTIPECALWGLRGAKPLYYAATRLLAWWLRTLLSRCDAVATPTETAATLLREHGYERAVAVISNGVDTDRFSPGLPDEKLRQRLSLDDRPVVLYTGRLDAEKQMDIWLRAVASLTSRNRAQFVVGGQGADRERLEQLAHDLGLGRNVHFIGYLSDEDYPAIYRLADAYFITSPVELQSISTLEAVASGLPVVAVNAAALPELVSHGENGYLVPPGDWQAAGASLQTLLDDAELSERMGARSRAMGLTHDLQLSISQYELFLRGVLNTKAGDRVGEPTAAAG